MKEYKWPYENEIGDLQIDQSEVLVLGGGLAGCFAAIAAGQKGQIRHHGGKGGYHQKRQRGNRF